MSQAESSFHSKLPLLFLDIVNRVPLKTLQNFFKKIAESKGVDFSAGNSSRETYSKLEDYVRLNDQQINEVINMITEWYINDHLLNGEKVVHFYDIGSEVASSLCNLLEGAEPDDSPYTTSFPLTHPITERLSPEIEEQLYIVNISDYEEGAKALIISAIRHYSERLKLDENVLSENARELYADVLRSSADTEVSVTTKHRSQMFDVIVIHPNGLLELRVDNPRMSEDGKPMPVRERQEAFVQTRKRFETYVSSLIGNSWTLGEPYNLISVIDSMYQDHSEGIIRLLGFTTNNSGAKEIKANYKDPKDCCRSDAYHEGGLQAVHNLINPYRLHITWGAALAQGELRIPGTIYCLERENYPCNEAIITRTFSYADYVFIRERILDHYHRQ